MRTLTAWFLFCSAAPIAGWAVWAAPGTLSVRAGNALLITAIAYTLFQMGVGFWLVTRNAK